MTLTALPPVGGRDTGWLSALTTLLTITTSSTSTTTNTNNRFMVFPFRRSSALLCSFSLDYELQPIRVSVYVAPDRPIICGDDLQGCAWLSP
jgi:hypothetical protein